MYLTQEQINALSQNLRKKRLKLELLDSNMKTIDSIEGTVINGSISVDANNDIRRSGTVELSIPINVNYDSFFDQIDGFSVEVGGKFWIDRNIKIHIGIEDITSPNNNTVWYKMGVFLINNPIKTFSSDSFVISFECVDLMAKLTGMRQGQLTGQSTIIEKGHYVTEDGQTTYHKTKLSEALSFVVSELGGFYKYSIAQIPKEYEYLPYDIKVGVGASVYDILKQLMDIISTWQIYFDLDGVLIIEPIPSGESSIIYNIDKNHYISHTLNSNFENVKNQVVVYGRCNTLSYYTENTTGETDTVWYLDNGDGTSTLKLVYKDIDYSSWTISGTTFGFHGIQWMINSQPINRVKIYSDPDDQSSLIVDAELVNFENSNNSFGITYSSSYVNKNSIMPDEIYFIRIYDATIKLNDEGIEVVDTSQPMVFEFMGKQCVSYNMVDDRENSPFYVNNGINKPNFYAGQALFENYYIKNNSENISSVKIIDYSAFYNKTHVEARYTFTFKRDNIWLLSFESYNSSMTGIVTTLSEYFIEIEGTPVEGDSFDIFLIGLGNNYSFKLNLSEGQQELENGTIITFLANSVNGYSPDKNYTSILIRDNNNNVILSNVPLVKNIWDINNGNQYRPYLDESKIYNDYTVWQIQYDKINNCFVFLGRCPTVITKVCAGGEYDNIYADQLAYERCLYELFLHTNMNNSISLGIVPNYILDVNSKIPFNPLDAIPQNIVLSEQEKNKFQTEYFLIKQITYPLGISNTPQDISAIKIYEDKNLLG